MDDLDVEAPFMRMVEHLGLGKRDGFRVLELPYEQEELSFFVLLPDARDGLADLESRLDPATLDGWLTDLDMQRVRCILPRFRTTSRFELGKVLAGMGMKDAFSGSRADFSGITGRKDLAISDVVHKAFVDVFEAGTEAAAATAVVMKRMSISHEEPPVDFRADHPFLFLIRHRDTGAILFMGRLTDPS
jgi:serpin B